MEYKSQNGTDSHGLPSTIIHSTIVQNTADEKASYGENEKSSVVSEDTPVLGDGREPTDEEKITLRKVAAPMPNVAIAMCLIEFAERASKSFSVFFYY